MPHPPKLVKRQNHKLHIRRSPWAPLPLCGEPEPFAQIYIDPRYHPVGYGIYKYCGKCLRWWYKGQAKKLRGERALYWPPDDLVTQSEVPPMARLTNPHNVTYKLRHIGKRKDDKPSTRVG